MLKKKRDLTTSERVIAYTSTIMCNCSFLGLIGSYAMIKKPLSDDLSFQQGFLGLVDGLSFFTRSFGLILLLIFPSAKPKRDYFINCILIVAFLLVIPFLPSINTHTELILAMVFLITGFSRAYNFVPFLIANQYFDAEKEDKGIMKLWIACSGFGDIMAILGIGLLMKLGKVSWKVCFIISIVLFLVLALYLYLGTEEVDMSIETENQSADRDEMDRQGQNNRQNPAVQPPKKNPIHELKQFLGNIGNLLWVLDSGLLTSIYYTILMWLPYYFEKMNYGENAVYITIAIPVSLPFGVGIYTLLVSKLSAYQKQLNFILIFLCCWDFLGLCLIPESEYSQLMFIILLFLSGVLMGGPLSYQTSLECKKRSSNNREHYIAIITYRISYQFLAFLELTIVGHLMQKNLKWLLYFMVVLMTIDFFLHVFRNIFFPALDRIEEEDMRNNSLVEEEQVGHERNE